jgi:hypothetical protein
MSVALVPIAALPWLQGFFAPVASTEKPAPGITDELSEWRSAGEGCVADAYGGLSLTAELGGGEGEERVLASFSQGVVVLDRDRHMIAQTPGFDCEGSADGLVAMAAGDGGVGAPLLAMAATTGGKNENMTWLALYRVAGSGELQPVFVGEVERHAGHTTRTGTVTLIPGGLVYRAPSGELSLWIYDNARGAYVQELESQPIT